ncbi:hypothetical protein Tco_0689198 [Tanacetum coccineum]
MVGIKTAMPSMTTSRAMLRMSFRATIKGVIELVKDMSGCKDIQKVKFTAGSFVSKALTWEEFCPINEMRKLETEFWNHAMVGASHAAYTDRFHELARAVQKAGTLTDETVRNESLKRNPERRGNGGEPSRDRNARDDKKKTRTRNAFATTTNPVRRENTCTTPNQKELNMRQRRWIELFSDYDCEIRYHLGKANVVADALIRKEIVKPKRVRAMNMALQSSIKDRILAA